jgi:hypothetical protein
LTDDLVEGVFGLAEASREMVSVEVGRAKVRAAIRAGEAAYGVKHLKSNAALQVNPVGRVETQDGQD